jgi:cell division protein FtsZ
MINVDFADIKAVMTDAGSALMGIGLAAGEGRAEKAALMAINSPLLDLSISGARGVLFAISGGDDLTIHEIQEAAKIVTESIDKESKVIFGTISDDKLKKGEMKITVIATGFPTDLPKRSLFQSKINDKTLANSTKEEVIEAVKKETDKNGDYIKKNDKDKTEKVENDLFIDDTDDWSTVPAFLRRKK